MNIVIKVNDETKAKMIDYFKPKMRPNTPKYAIFQADEEDTVVTLYESGKAMFQGPSADVDAKMWQEINGQSTKPKENHDKYYYSSSIGSDEVGTGDYFGPIIVTSCYVNKDDINDIEALGVMDSKKLTDEKIFSIIPSLIKKVKYRSLILTNQEYNSKYGKENNLNKIKAIMHNKVLYQLVNEEKLDYEYIIVDEFAKENRYYEYISEATNIQRGITFLTKAEDKNLAVACASVISRYLFVKELNKISDELHIPLPKGAGPQVDSIGQEIVDKYGRDKLTEVAKLNFKNTERILRNIII